MNELIEMSKQGIIFGPEFGKKNLIQRVEYKYIKKENGDGIYSLIKYHNEFYAYLGPFLEFNEAKKHTEFWLSNTRSSFESLKTFLCEKCLELQNEKVTFFFLYCFRSIFFVNGFMA